MTWFPFLYDFPIRARSLVGETYCPSNKQLCTITEVCPPTPEGQSVVAVWYRSQTRRLLLVAGRRVVDKVTCEPINYMADDVQHLTSDGVVCCPNDEFPKAKKFFSDGKWKRNISHVSTYSVMFTKCYILYSLMFISFILY